MNTFTLNKPEVNQAATKLNEQGEPIDEATRKIIGELLLSLQKLKQRIA